MTYSPDFEECWQIYPRKVAKPLAYRSYQKAIKRGNTHGKIKHGVEQYSAYIRYTNTEQRFVCHFSTFLNQDRFSDNWSALGADYGGKSATSLSMAAAVKIVAKDRAESTMEQGGQFDGLDTIFQLHTPQ